METIYNDLHTLFMSDTVQLALSALIVAFCYYLKSKIDKLKQRDDLDFVVLENIGNLVCPAEFDTGANLNLTILSVPEGDDKPAKYPLMYEVSDVLVINKIDALPVFDFRKDYVEACAKRLNPQIKIFYISAKTGEGVKELADYLLEKIQEVNA